MDSPSASGVPTRDSGSHPPTVEEPRPLGLAFFLGVVVGTTATLLLTSDDPDDRAAPRTIRRPRRLIRRPDPEPPTLSDVVRREAIHVAESVIRDVGQVASRWVLEALAGDPEEGDEEIGPGPSTQGPE